MWVAFVYTAHKDLHWFLIEDFFIFFVDIVYRWVFWFEKKVRDLKISFPLVYRDKRTVKLIKFNIWGREEQKGKYKWPNWILFLPIRKQTASHWAGNFAKSLLMFSIVELLPVDGRWDFDEIVEGLTSCLKVFNVATSNCGLQGIPWLPSHPVYIRETSGSSSLNRFARAVLWGRRVFCEELLRDQPYERKRAFVDSS